MIIYIPSVFSICHLKGIIIVTMNVEAIVFLMSFAFRVFSLFIFFFYNQIKMID